MITAQDLQRFVGWYLLFTFETGRRIFGPIVEIKNFPTDGDVSVELEWPVMDRSDFRFVVPLNEHNKPVCLWFGKFSEPHLVVQTENSSCYHISSMPAGRSVEFLKPGIPRVQRFLEACGSFIPSK